MSRHAAPLSLLLPLLIALPACGGGEEDTSDITTKRYTLEFAPKVGQEAFSCQETFMLGSTTSEVAFTDFKLYVSEVALVREGGERVPLTLGDAAPWQSSGVALLDFEDGSGSCENGTVETRTSITGEAPAHDDYVGVAFTLGIPFDLNHADVAALPSPLNLPSMFWSWQGGRKFLRLDGKVDQAGGLRVHLGSTGCEGSNGDITSCAAANRGEVVLMGGDPTSHTIVVDAGVLFEGADLTPAEDRSLICMSEPGSEPCAPLYRALGVDPGTGSTSPSTQALFSLSADAHAGH